MIDSQEIIVRSYLTAIEDDLRQAMKLVGDIEVTQLYGMLTYHMGWRGKSSKSITRGKRIRPLLVLLSCSAAGGDWENALPAATAVELVHNFSLIHDDIEDHSALRRGRAAVWKKWGIAQGINAGDAMFTLAHLQLIRLKELVSQSAVIQAVEVLQQACLKLTHGQYLDLAFENRGDVTIKKYWSMVEGKTAALISASTELGAICASRDALTCAAYCDFGRLFGLAYQAQDDLLGIWGDSALTGKSNQSDLMTGKKTLPVLYCLSKPNEFADRWYQGSINPEDIEELTCLLENEGGKTFTQTKAAELANKALLVLETLSTDETPGEILKDLTLDLINRQS